MIKGSGDNDNDVGDDDDNDGGDNKDIFFFLNCFVGGWLI